MAKKTKKVNALAIHNRCREVSKSGDLVRKRIVSEFKNLDSSVVYAEISNWLKGQHPEGYDKATNGDESA